MKRRTATLLSCLLLSGAVLAWSPPTAGAQEAEDYRRDLEAFDKQMKATHPGLFDVHAEEQWDAAVSSLRERVDELDPIGFYLALARITALAQDGHSAVRSPDAFRRSAYPMAMAFFGEHLYVTCAEARYRAAVGGRVVAIGEASEERILADLAPLAGGDNAWGARGRMEFLLRHGELHRRLGWVEQGAESVTVVFDDGQQVRVALDGPTGSSVRGPLPPHGPAPDGWVTALAGGDVPLWQQHFGEPWWFEYLEDASCLYIGFNSVTDKPDEKLTDFWADVFDLAKAKSVTRMVIDMRHNGGGDGYKNQPLVHALIRSDDVNRPGRLFVLTGPRTFSAAIMSVAEIEQHTYALFVGEPSGAGPAHYGDATTLTLPGTGMRVRCSTVYHQFTDGRDKRRWVHPDVRTSVFFEDFVNGRDPTLEAALLYREADAASFGQWPPKAHWMRPSQRNVPARGAD